MKTFRTALVILAASTCACTSAAVPRFASRTGASCQSCHINPTGGAMRQAFGVQYGREQLPVPGWSKDMELEDFSNVITNVLGVGADFRMLYYSQNFAGGGSSNGFWQMQGDLYLNFRVARKVSFFLKKGLRDGFEVFGLFNILPASGHIKAGKFLPNYGIKMDDHTAYIRQMTKFTPDGPRPERTGIEVAVSPGAFTFMGGIYNGEEGVNFPSASSDKDFLGRAEGMFAISKNLFLGLGGNVFSRKESGVTWTYYGGFGSLSYGDLTFLGEADILRSTTLAGKTTGFVSYVEADYVVTPGFDVKLAYDFYDNNIDVKDGAKSRYSIGFEFFPLSGVELRPVYRIVKQTPDAGNQNELHLLLHLYL